MNSIFNFNIFACFKLSEHMSFILPQSKNTELLLDMNQGIVAFKHHDSRNAGGIILRMGTIPSEIYHVFITGQLLLGDKTSMVIRNNSPVLNLAPTRLWQMGCEEVRTVCFTALGHRTDLLITTNVHCFSNTAPYEFIITQLDILPDSLMCQGFIKGITGNIGLTGAVGSIGSQGIDVVGSTGSTGSTAPLGPQGLVGPSGPPGLNGVIGSIGGIGPLGVPGTVRGETGVIGPAGSGGGMGLMGVLGPTGFVGLTGSQGSAGFIVGQNVFSSAISLSWTRGTNVTVAFSILNINITGEIVTVRLNAFVSIGIAGVNACLQSISLPSQIRTAVNRDSYFPCILEVNGVSVESVINIGPSVIRIFSDVTLNCLFLPTDVVLFATQVFTYIRS